MYSRETVINVLVCEYVRERYAVTGYCYTKEQQLYLMELLEQSEWELGSEKGIESFIECAESMEANSMKHPRDYWPRDEHAEIPYRPGLFQVGWLFKWAYKKLLRLIQRR